MRLKDGISSNLRELEIRRLQDSERRIAFMRAVLLLLAASVQFAIWGCSSSAKKISESNEDESESVTASFSSILQNALAEQMNPMYRKDADTTLLYWLDDLPLELPGSTKCNIFALNVLERSGFATPNENCTTSELFDTTLFANILPVISRNSCSLALPGDLLVWNGHVIIFESLVSADEIEYALGWWAGTRKEDDGEKVINNVCHGKYPLEEDYIVRRPQKR